MNEPSLAEVVRDLHKDLRRKYALHGTAIEKVWHSFDSATRAKCLKAGLVDGGVLAHPLDRSLGDVYKFVPEINLRDIAESGSDFLLDHLRHRANKSLIEQLQAGVRGGQGDLDFIELMMRTKNLRHATRFRNCITFFMDDEKYGESFEIAREKGEVLNKITPALKARVAVPQATGELILIRQQCLLKSFNILVEDILDEGAWAHGQKNRSKKMAKSVTQALSKLTILEAPAYISFSDLLAYAHDQMTDFEDYLGLLSVEPVVLKHAVNLQFVSQPELIADEKGRTMPFHTDKYISGSVFDVVHNAVQGTAIWTYIAHLLTLLSIGGQDKVLRTIVLQELSNACYLEYGRVQTTLKRQVQRCSGVKWFKRISGAYDKAGNARIVVKGNTASLTRDNPQLQYLISLCLPDTSVSKAADWMKKLSNLHKVHPLEREKLEESEVDSLGDLAVIIEFSQDLSNVIPMPSFSRNKGQTFVSRMQELQTKLNLLKNQVDLSEFAALVDNLLVPGMAEGALQLLDKFVIEKAGMNIGILYQVLVEDCLSGLQQQFEMTKIKLTQGGKATPPTPPLADPDAQKFLSEQQEQNQTTPTDQSSFEFAPRKDVATTVVPASPPQTFQVSASTAQVFATFFAKSVSQGSVTWSAFEAAMGDMGFSVLLKLGSVYTFYPPDTMLAKKPLTVHQPLRFKIEGHMILIFARRLRTIYGWDESTFVVA
ncbi:ipa protein [Grosmannia clavigera kw1407]|uniref:Ipa protein n=1 Tax=Grosmannia clavigera (strain kw1407 / UAMH 11150) TaxID=655863 RepID=F0XLA9_GROCL|nr:ipa protein [Grosmannia clavigera kw1407]EFX01370.1 ipa protein [Grosmannia clavigera kw1407]